MSMTREEVMAGRKNGLRYWDEALMHKTKEVLVKQALEHFENEKYKNEAKFPNMFKGNAGWYQMLDSFKAIIKQTLKLNGNPQQSWNLDEILTKEEINLIMEKYEMGAYTQLHKRIQIIL